MRRRRGCCWFEMLRNPPRRVPNDKLVSALFVCDQVVLNGVVPAAYVPPLPSGLSNLTPWVVAEQSDDWTNTAANVDCYIICKYSAQPNNETWLTMPRLSVSFPDIPRCVLAPRQYSGRDLGFSSSRSESELVFHVIYR
ncbi:hypothetical protein ACJJTC_007672 [Scirpophaga incertulas]